MQKGTTRVISVIMLNCLIPWINACVAKETTEIQWLLPKINFEKSGILFSTPAYRTLERECFYVLI